LLVVVPASCGEAVTVIVVFSLNCAVHVWVLVCTVIVLGLSVLLSFHFVNIQLEFGVAVIVTLSPTV
jgi:hypothetical protein